MAAPWMLIFTQLLVADAGVRCAHARGVLADAVARLAVPVHVADTEADHSRFRDVVEMLTGASNDLNLAASEMEATEILALCGAAIHPAAPDASIDLIDADLPLRPALSLLQSARGCAEDACYSVAWCGGQLSTARHLRFASNLGNPGLPGADGFIDAHRVAAHRNLEAARGLAVVSAALAMTAHWVLVH